MVPEGWTAESLGTVARIVDCKHRTPKYASTGAPIVSPGNIRWGELNFTHCRRISDSDLDAMMDHCTVRPGDIVMGRNQSIGIGAYVGEDTRFALGQDTILIQPHCMDARFVYQFFSSDLFQRQILRLAGGSTFARINLKDIRHLRLLRPTPPEQRKIADVLSTWDRAIELAEALLANARDQKRALMQTLLTGKRRFSDFEGEEWREVRLGDIGSFKKGSGLSKEKLDPEGKFRCVLYGELYTTYGEVIDRVVSGTGHREGLPSNQGDVLMPSSTTTNGRDLAIAACIERDGVLLGGDINVFRPDRGSVVGQFLAYLLTHIKSHEISRFAQGITIIHMYGRHLLSLKVLLPSIEEQRRILQPIGLAEDAIRAQEQIVFRLRSEKEALMQQLLSGKRRVTVYSETAEPGTRADHQADPTDDAADRGRVAARRAVS